MRTKEQRDQARFELTRARIALGNAVSGMDHGSILAATALLVTDMHEHVFKSYGAGSEEIAAFNELLADVAHTFLRLSEYRGEPKGPANG